MALHGDASGSNGDRGGRTDSGRIITQAQIRRARRVHTGEEPLGPNLTEDKLAALRFSVTEQKAQIASEKWVLERFREEADTSSHRRANLSSYYSFGAMQRSHSRNISRAIGSTPQGISRQSSMKWTYCLKQRTLRSWPPPRILLPMHPTTMSTWRNSKHLHKAIMDKDIRRIPATWRSTREDLIHH
jgi:hypothetical protein